MKLLTKLLAIISIMFSSSCAMIANDKKDSVSIESSPPGAQIYIEGKYMGNTPATINVEPKSYKVQLKKPGYGSTELQLEYWVAAKTKACMMDAMTAMFIVPLYSFYWSGYCNEFKEDKYSAVIPQNAAPAKANNRNYYNNRSRQYNYYRN
ncbi:MAG: PEGA domain-containing protein [Rickettsiales bacterium]|nr:PEGA domain-containing protein [Rickettsiales bacterium]